MFEISEDRMNLITRQDGSRHDILHIANTTCITLCKNKIHLYYPGDKCFYVCFCTSKDFSFYFFVHENGFPPPFFFFYFVDWDVSYALQNAFCAFQIIFVHSFGSVLSPVFCVPLFYSIYVVGLFF